MVHEAGHLATAKIFKVYCFEYAIGFGPKLFSKKRKKGETYFSIRAIPFGGFVSMYGESETVPEGLEVDPSRSLLAIKKWKRAIIMAAGVIMNFLLAIVIFFIYEVSFPTYVARYGHITVKGGLAELAGLRSEEAVYTPVIANSNFFVFYDDEAVVTYTDDTTSETYVGFNYNSLTLKDTSLINHIVIYPKTHFGEINTFVPTIDFNEISTHTYEGDNYEARTFNAFYRGIYEDKHDDILKVHNIIIGLTENANDKKDDDHLIAASFTVKDDDYSKFNNMPIDSKVTVVGDINQIEIRNKVKKNFVVEEYDFPNVDFSYNILVHREDKKVPKNVSFSLYVMDDNNPSGRGIKKTLAYSNNDPLRLVRNGTTYRVDADLGLSMQLDENYHDFGTAVKRTFVDFGESSIAIYKGLASLFTTKDGWKNVGGIIAIGVSTTQTLQQSGFGTYLFYWGLISVNLGIVNLLPFPGLDGWHLLVLAVEGIFRKEIPAKVKNTVAAIGIMLLFGLMILIIIKDVIGLF